MSERTDRELLELAAKAAGFIDDATDQSEAYGLHRGEDGVFYTTDSDGWREWSPLADDGDALRLAVKLGIQITPPSTQYPHAFAMEPTMQRAAYREDDVVDPFSATRRAIVRAAAEIGANMQS